MRKKCLVLVALLGLGLSGCGSDAKYKELEERVAKLESVVGVNNSNETEQETSIHNTQAAENAVYEEKQYEGVYFMDDLSGQEVVAECEYFFDNIPKKGSSYEEYFATFKVTPKYTRTDGEYLECIFYNPSDGGCYDIINELIIKGTQTEMDGSIGYIDNRISVTIIMTVHDYEKAVSIYEGLYDVVVNEYVQDIEEEKRATTWVVNGIENGRQRVNLLSMSKRESGYNISATYYINFG